MKNKDCCPMCSFGHQVINAAVEVAKKHGLSVKGSVIPVKGAYRIRFTASPDKAKINER